MAKAPTAASLASSAAEIEKAMLAAIGGNDPESTVTQFLDTGFPVLNHASNAEWDGGLPVGRLTEIAGPPSAGKTAIATRAMAVAQMMGGVAGFNDHERSFSMRLAPNLGLDPTPGRFIYKKPETFEESIGIFALAVTTIRKHKLIKPEAPICWVFDSMAAMVPQSVLYDSNGNRRDPKTRNMNDNTALARCTSQHLPGVVQLAEDCNVAVIFLNQFRKDISVKFGDPRKTTGGDSAPFYFSQRLWLSASQIKEKVNGKDEVVGMEVTGKFMKNKVARPFQSASWRFMFQADGSGRFDRERSLVEFLNDEKLLPSFDVAANKACRPGYHYWEGKQMTREAIARLVESEGDVGFAKLKALLPARYEPVVVAEIDGGTIEPEEPIAA